MHSKYINNKSKSVCNRGRLIRGFLWPMSIFRNQGSRYYMLNLLFYFFPFSHKREFVWVNYYSRSHDGNSSSSLIHSNNTWLKAPSQNRSEDCSLCLQTDTSVSTDLHMHINYLSRRYGGFPGNGKVMRSNDTLSDITGKMKWNWLKIFWR